MQSLRNCGITEHASIIGAWTISRTRPESVACLSLISLVPPMVDAAQRGSVAQKADELWKAANGLNGAEARSVGILSMPDAHRRVYIGAESEGVKLKCMIITCASSAPHWQMSCISPEYVHPTIWSDCSAA